MKSIENEQQTESTPDDYKDHAKTVEFLASFGMDKNKIRSILMLPHDAWGQACKGAFAIGREKFIKRVKSVAAKYVSQGDAAEGEVIAAHAKGVIERDGYPDIPAWFA